MRDTLKTKEYFKDFYELDKTYWNKYMESYHIKNQDPEQYNMSSCKYNVFVNTFYKFYSGYSYGLAMSELLPDMKLIIQMLIETKEDTESNYEDMGLIIYFIIISNQYEFLNECKKLLEHSVDRDLYLDSLMQYLDLSWKISTEKINWPKKINPLNEVIHLSKTDKIAAVGRLKKYLDKEWFKTLNEGIITNRSLEKGKYRGYWCIESAALVKLLKLDDAELKECKYYPYDMAHFCN